MNTLQQKFSLTELEAKMLQTISEFYDSEDIVCYNEKLTPSEKGIIGSLMKKELVYDSNNGVDLKGNFFPSEDVLNFLELN